MSINVKPDHSVLKGTSLMGFDGASPCIVECNDGKITRVRPFDYEDHFGREKLDEERWEIQAHGRKFGGAEQAKLSHIAMGYKKRVYSPNRVAYPLKRVDWDPDGERNPQNRGKSKFVRISWDEAAEIAAKELKRVIDKYGISAVMAQSDGHAEAKHLSPGHGPTFSFLRLFGGYTCSMRNMDSWEGWHLGSRLVWGGEPVGEMTPFANLYPDIAENADGILFWGCDPETTSLGFIGHTPSRLCYWLSSLGLESVYICPDLNYAAALHADKWIPVLPNTDAALQLAIAYIWINEGTFDHEYVDTHAVGFEEFKAYVLGEEDGIPKDAKWASEKCGVPVWTIKALAQQWGKKTFSICHGNGGGLIRGPYASEPARLEAILLGMQGLGKPGVHQAKMLEWDFGSGTKFYPLPYSPKKNYVVPPMRVNTPPAQGDLDPEDLELLNTGEVPPAKREVAPKLTEYMRFRDLPGQCIPRCLIPRAIMEDEVVYWGMQMHPNRQRPDPDTGKLRDSSRYLFRELHFPKPGLSRIHMIWCDVPCNTTCWNNGYSYVEAYRNPEIETIIMQHPWLENDCYLGDLILPVTTKFEQQDLLSDNSSATFNSVYYEDAAIEPVGESMNDMRVLCRIAKEIGPEYFAQMCGNFTDDELLEELYSVCGADELMEWERFKKEKILLMPRDKDSHKEPAGLRRFAEDPENNPLTTPSGKLEFRSSYIDKYMPDDEERPPVPKWIENGPAHQERITAERAKDYPLLCVSNHGHWRVHAQGDDQTWSREAPTCKIRGFDGYQYEPVWLNPKDAEARGIKQGDVCKIFNERGVVLCAAYVAERIIPGAVSMDHGARFDPIDATWLDRGGAINLITPKSLTSTKATGMVTGGFLVDVQKVTDEEWNEWKEKYSDAFERVYDEGVGTCRKTWVINED